MLCTDTEKRLSVKSQIRTKLSKGRKSVPSQNRKTVLACRWCGYCGRQKYRKA